MALENMQQEMGYRIEHIDNASMDQRCRYERLFRSVADGRRGDLPCPDCFRRDEEHPGKLTAREVLDDGRETVRCLQCTKTFFLPPP